MFEIFDDFLEYNKFISEVYLNNNKISLPETTKLLQNKWNLEKLFLHNNLINEIPNDFLLNCTTLKELYLSNNKIWLIPDNFLKTCTSL